MAVLRPFILLTISLWCSFLSGNATSYESDRCDQRNIGLKSGEKCTFAENGLCNWRSFGRGTRWEVKDDEAYANMFGTGKGAKAVLTSPWMCEDNVSTICTQFDFRLDSSYGGKLTLTLCNFTSQCQVLWSANSRDDTDVKWHHINRSASITRSAQFQFQFTGEKIKDDFGVETNFYLDNIVYENIPCIIGSFPSSTTTDISTSGEKITTDTYTDLPTTMMSDDKSKKASTTDDEDSSQLIMIAALIAFLMLTVAVVVVVIYFRRQRADADPGSKKSSISRDPRDSIVMATNDLYDVTDAVPNTDEGIRLQDLDSSPDPENYYSVVHDTDGNDEVNTLSNLGVVVHHGCGNYEVVDLDEDNVHWKPQQPALGISSQS